MAKKQYIIKISKQELDDLHDVAAHFRMCTEWVERDDGVTDIEDLTRLKRIRKLCAKLKDNPWN